MQFFETSPGAISVIESIVLSQFGYRVLGTGELQTTTKSKANYEKQENKFGGLDLC